MILAWLVVTVFYIGVIVITVGVLDKQELVKVVDGAEQANTYVPISLAASKFMGLSGFAILGFAAIAAFVTTANGGIFAASRSPMAMSRDRLAIVFLDIVVLVKTASTLMIILFILVNASVIIMRESRIQSYRPKFKSPLYPYIHIFAIIAYVVLIIDMGRPALSV